MKRRYSGMVRNPSDILPVSTDFVEQGGKGNRRQDSRQIKTKNNKNSLLAEKGCGNQAVNRKFSAARHKWNHSDSNKFIVTGF